MVADVLSEVGFDDPRVVADGVRIALGDELAVFQHPDVLAHAHDHFHVVLDEQDGQVELVADMPDEAHEFGAFLRVHPGGGLVEEQEVRAGRQGAGDFKAPLGKKSRFLGRNHF